MRSDLVTRIHFRVYFILYLLRLHEQRADSDMMQESDKALIDKAERSTHGSGNRSIEPAHLHC